MEEESQDALAKDVEESGDHEGDNNIVSKDEKIKRQKNVSFNLLKILTRLRNLRNI